MLKSMTAYAESETTEEGQSVQVEIRSYNHRHLDLFCKLQQGYAALTEKLRPLVTQVVARGRVEVRIQIVGASQAAIAYSLDTNRAAAYLEALEKLRTALDVAADIPLDLIVGQSGCIQPLEDETLPDTLWPLVERCVTAALDALDRMRMTEGRCIEADFGKRLARLKNGIGHIESLADGLLPVYARRLRERIADLVKDTVAVDMGRVEQEAALLAAKSDIAEEVLRINSHLDQFAAIMADSQPSGLRLNFLLQELFREFNTIGSKAGKSDISHQVVDMKAELEKLKEQVLNVE